MKLFVTGTGTDVGKTWLTSALALRLRERGRRVAALKPVETGCDPEPRDARMLAAVAGSPSLADIPGLHRGRMPLAPWSATLAGDPPPPPLDALVTAVRIAAEGFDDVLVEGAGGLLVPYDPTHDFADLAARLGYPLLLVAPNRLGTLSHVLTAVESANRRGLAIAAVALTAPTPEPDLSASTNRQVLEARLRLPVLELAHEPVASPAPIDRLLTVLGV